jgi:hypothetical protein
MEIVPEAMGEGRFGVPDAIRQFAGFLHYFNRDGDAG